MTLLLELERSYQASSKLISTIDNMFGALLRRWDGDMKTTFTSTSAISEATRLVADEAAVAAGGRAKRGYDRPVRRCRGDARQQDGPEPSRCARSRRACSPSSRATARWRLRLDATQSALKSIADNAQDFLNQLHRLAHWRWPAAPSKARRGPPSTALIDIAQHAVQRRLAVRRHQRRREADRRLRSEPRRPPASRRLTRAFVAAFGVTQSDPAGRQHLRDRHADLSRRSVRRPLQGSRRGATPGRRPRTRTCAAASPRAS